MISGQINQFFKPVSNQIYLAQENRKALIYKGESVLKDAVSAFNSSEKSKQDKSDLNLLNHEEKMVFEVSDDSDEDDLVVEVSKEEAQKALTRSYEARPVNWKYIATYARQESTSAAIEKFGELISGKDRNCKMAALNRWK